MDATKTETETENVIGIVAETVDEMTTAIMSSHRMHGMRHVEAPAAAVLDSRVLAGLNRSIGRKAGMHIMTDNGMMKIVLPRKKRTVTAIVMTIRGMVEDGRKFAEVVD